METQVCVTKGKLMVPQGERMKTKRAKSRAWEPWKGPLSREGPMLTGPGGLGGTKSLSPLGEAGPRSTQGKGKRPPPSHSSKLAAV